MDLNERQSEILERVRADGRVEVDDLARSFAVTSQTIRRDLNELSRAGLLARTHGGAVLARSVSNLGYAERRTMAHEAKLAIAARAAAMIPNGCSVILNIGTTTEQVAHALRRHTDLVVITNNINVATILAGSERKEIILAGGLMRQADGAIVGEEAVSFIRHFKADYAVIGTSALDEDGSVMDYDLREVAVARAILARARHKILVADVSKFQRSAPVQICEVGDLDTVVTDRRPPEAFCEAALIGETRIEIAAGHRLLFDGK